MNKAPGRPAAGGPDRRALLLESAVELFTRNGYTGTTLRMVAAHAGCDVALVSYYFGSKRGLFAEVMRLTVSPPEVLRAALTGDRHGLGERLATGVILAWEHPDAGPRLVGLVRASMAHPELRAGLAQYLDHELTEPLVEFLGGRHAREEAATIVSLVAGHIFTRYVLPMTGSKAVPTGLAIARMAALITATQRIPRSV